MKNLLTWLENSYNFNKPVLVTEDGVYGGHTDIEKIGTGFAIKKNVYRGTKCFYFENYYKFLLFVKANRNSFNVAIDFDDHDCCADGYMKISLKSHPKTYLFMEIPFNAYIHEVIENIFKT